MSIRTLAGASAIAAALLCGACSKSEPPPKATATPQPPKSQAAAPTAPSATAEIDAAVKERLARQEAASRLFDRPTPAPAPVPAPNTALAPAPAPAPAMPRSASPMPERKPEPPPRTTETVPAKPEPPKKAESARKSEPAKAEAPPPRLDVAAAKPSAAFVAAGPVAAAPRVLSRVEPDYPRNAPDNGTVRARITMDASGNVTRVEVLEAYPRRVFDRAVVSALSQWRFNEGPPDRTFDTEVVFRR